MNDSKTDGVMASHEPNDTYADCTSASGHYFYDSQSIHCGAIGKNGPDATPGVEVLPPGVVSLPNGELELTGIKRGPTRVAVAQRTPGVSAVDHQTLPPPTTDGKGRA